MELQKNNAKYSIILYLSPHYHTYDVPYNTLCMACHISEHTIYITPTGSHATLNITPHNLYHPNTPHCTTEHSTHYPTIHNRPHYPTTQHTMPLPTHIPTLTVTTHHTSHQPLPHQTYKHKLFKCCAFGTGSTLSQKQKETLTFKAISFFYCFILEYWPK